MHFIHCRDNVGDARCVAGELKSYRFTAVFRPIWNHELLKLSFVMEVVAGPQNCPVNSTGILEIFVTCTKYTKNDLSSLQ